LKFGLVVANDYKSHVVINGLVTFWLIFTSLFLTLPLYEVSNLNMVINLLCHFFGDALVSTFATMSSVEQYSNVTLPFSTHFRTK
jgi:hypothetical protein